MMQSILNDEAGRLLAVRQTGLLDTPPSRAFDRIARLATRLFNVPTALISLIDQDRQWLKARVGFSLTQTRRCDAFCDHTIRANEVFVIEDAERDPAFATNPLVRGAQHVRFYAGAPLITSEGYAIGALCVMDSARRRFSKADAEALRELAETVMREIDLRHAVGRLDPITLIPNRAQFEEDIADAVHDHAGERRALLLFDLSLGNAQQLIRAMGVSFFERFLRGQLKTLAEYMSNHAALYQFNSVSFGLVLTGDIDDLDGLTQTLVELLRRPIDCDGIPVTAAICAGLCRFTIGDAEPEAILRHAYSAMHSAWEAGRLYSHFDVESDRSQRRAFHLLVDAAEALRQNDQMVLHFQPRVLVGSGRCVAVEALVRWTHPSLGPIPPGEFIPLIETTELIRPLTAWVVEHSLAQAAAWCGAGRPLRVSINVSGRNLDEPDFVSRLGDAMHRHDVPPDLIELEFTESALARNGDQAFARLSEIRAMGIEIAIDDFGTGYSNLSYLRRLPSRVLKLDRSFIRSLATDLRDQTIVRATINMAHELGYRVVAEGVETAEIMEMISALGCDEVQGYLFARPMPAGQILRTLEADLTRAGAAGVAFV